MLVADRLFERENNEPPAQASDENRRPIFMVSDLNSDNIARAECFKQNLEIAGAFFHVDKSPQNLVARVENGRRAFCAAKRLLPGVKQRVGGFHTLRAPLGESRFGAPFRR